MSSASTTMAPNVRGVGAPGRRKVYSMCGMCAVRCPMEVTVENGRVTWIQGNPHDEAIGASLCAKGAAGLAFESDDQRPQTPLIRKGPRGSGQWRRASWDEALDYVADKLKETIEAFGPRGIALSDRGGCFADLTRTFVKALGSPNYFNHDASCNGNAHNAGRSIYGFPSAGLVFDYANTKHLVLYGRNIVESLMVKEAKAFMAAVANGMRVTYIDPRADRHGLQGHPLLAGEAQQRLRAEPRPHPRDPEDRELRQGLRRALRHRHGRPARGGEGDDARMAGSPHRGPRRRAPRLREGDRRPGAARDLPPGLDVGASQAVVPRHPQRADPERPDGQHRDPRRLPHRQAARVLRPQEPEAAGLARPCRHRAARGRRRHLPAVVGPGHRRAAPGSSPPWRPRSPTASAPTSPIATTPSPACPMPRR